jgi:hypothetical protein
MPWKEQVFLLHCYSYRKTIGKDALPATTDLERNTHDVYSFLELSISQNQDFFKIGK